MRVSSILSTVALASVALGAIVNSRQEAEHEQKAADIINSIKANVLQSLDEREAEFTKRGQEVPCSARNIAFRRE